MCFIAFFLKNFPEEGDGRGPVLYLLSFGISSLPKMFFCDNPTLIFSLQEIASSDQRKRKPGQNIFTRFQEMSKIYHSKFKAEKCPDFLLNYLRIFRHDLCPLNDLGFRGGKLSQLELLECQEVFRIPTKTK